jgi:hypothetical protein
VNGKRQGEGTIRFASGETATGTWTDGALDGAGAAAPEAPADSEAPAEADAPAEGGSAPASE